MPQKLQESTVKTERLNHQCDNFNGPVGMPAQISIIMKTFEVLFQLEDSLEVEAESREEAEEKADDALKDWPAGTRIVEILDRGSNEDN